MAGNDQIEQAFLDSIRTNPDDTITPLIYADWLEERGDPRAEFIRVQCAIQSLREGDPDRPRLETQEGELLARHRKEWEKPLRKLGASKVIFHRGMPSKVELDAGAFLRKAGELFACAPTIHSLKLIRHHTEADFADRLASCPYLTKLQALDLSNNAISDVELEVLAASPYVRHLRTLNLSRNGIHDVGVRAIAGSPQLANIKSLGLARCWVMDDGVRVLATSPHLNQLQRLDISGNGISGSGVQALAESSRLADLMHLNLGDNQIDDKGVIALAHSPHLPALQTLVLAGNRISDRGAQALVKSQRTPRLQELSLDHNALISRRIMEEVESVFGLSQTTRLDRNSRCL